MNDLPDHVRPLLFISNGHGEDSIAAQIIKGLPKGTLVQAYPMVGPGDAFAQLCPIVGPRAFMPSQGWRHTKGSGRRDSGSILKSIGPGISFLKSQKNQNAAVVCVGDGVGPLLCMLAGLKIDIYLDVFKSGYAHRYTGFEKFVLARVANTIYCRDDILAKALADAGLNGQSHGNIMLDCVPYADYDMQTRRSAPLALTLLPGSRDTIAENLAVQLKAISMMPDDIQVDLFMALAGGVDPSELAKQLDMEYAAPKNDDGVDAGAFVGEGMKVYLSRGALGNLVEGSDVVLSQAGTATQQALGLGKPVITYNRADNRAKRMADEQALMGEARILCTPDPQVIADETAQLLRDQDERQRLGAIGQARLGGPGTMAAIVAQLLEIST